MTKAELAELERVFAHDIQCTGYPAPLRNNKATRKLIADGMLIQVHYEMPFPPLGMAAFTGLALTIPGHMAYCMSCADEDQP